jgi:osmotically-inducible protein OsmY
MNKSITLCLIPLLTVIFVAGCAPAVIGGVAGSAAVLHDTRTTGTVVEDEAIELKAARAIFNDKELFSRCHVNVTSYNMNVLVTGEAPTESLKQKVIHIVRNTPKVKRVYDEIIISEPSSIVSRSSDSVLTTKVKTQLFLIKDFDSTRVKVLTERGIVYLMGFLTKKEAKAVTEMARRVGGVQKVAKLFEYLD